MAAVTRDVVTGGRPSREVRVLGPLELVRGGRRVDAGSRKQRLLLLCLVASAGRPVSTDRLVAALWGDEPPGRPGASIRAYVSNLRQLLEPGRRRDQASMISWQSGAYALHLPSGSLDGWSFERDLEAAREATAPSLRLARVRRALTRWRGEPFAEAVGAGFADTSRSRLLALRREAIELEVEALLGTDRVRESVAAAEALVADDQLSEIAWRHLMAALARAGRPAEALRAFDRAADALDRQLGVAPGAETVSLRDEIRQGRIAGPRIVDARAATVEPVPVRRAVEPVGPPAPPTELLVGRAEESAVLRAVVERAVAGERRLAVVAGAPGVGKTKLVEAALVEAAERTAAIRVRCDPGAGSVGLLPLLTAVREHLELLDGATVADLVGEDAELLRDIVPWLPRSAATAEPAADDVARFRFFAAIVRLLNRLAERRPLLLVVDDVHWADERLWELLVRLAFSPPRAGMAVVVALRRGELADASAASLATVSGALGSTVVELEDLGPEAIVELVVGTLGPRARPIAVEVHRRSGGNPFFASELVRAVDRDDPVRSFAAVDAPASLREVVLGRIASLPGPATAFLELAALCGPTFELSFVARVAERRPDEAAELADIAVTTGLLVEVGDRVGRLAFRHHLVRTAIRDAMPRVRRARRHAAIGTAMLDTLADRDATRVGELAHHLAEGAAAGTAREAAIVGRLAVDAALGRHDSAAAVAVAHGAIGALDHLDATAREEIAEVEADLWCDLADAHQRLSQVTESHVAARTALELARSNDLVAIAARAVLCLAGGPGTSPAIGYWAPAEEIIAAADELLAGPADDRIEPAVRALLLTAQAAASSASGRCDEAEAVSRRAVEAAGTVDDPVARARVVLGRARLLELAGSLPDRRAVTAEAVELAIAAGDTDAASAGLRQSAAIELEAGHLAGAEAAATRLDELAAATGGDGVALDAVCLRTALALALGRLDEAGRSATSALERFGHLDLARRYVPELQLGVLLIERHEVEPVLGRFVELAARQPSPAWEVRIAGLELQLGHDDAARARVEALPDRVVDPRSDPSLRFTSACMLADVLAELGDTARAPASIDALEPLAERMVVTPPALLLSGWVAVPLARLLGVVGRRDDADHWLRWAGERAATVGSTLHALRAEVARLEVDARRGRARADEAERLWRTATDGGYLGVAAWVKRIERRSTLAG